MFIWGVLVQLAREYKYQWGFGFFSPFPLPLLCLLLFFSLSSFFCVLPLFFCISHCLGVCVCSSCPRRLSRHQRVRSTVRISYLFIFGLYSVFFVVGLYAGAMDPARLVSTIRRTCPGTVANIHIFPRKLLTITAESDIIAADLLCYRDSSLLVSMAFSFFSFVVDLTRSYIYMQVLLSWL